MKRVVIADDERIIVRGLKKLIDWESFDLEVVGEANDGEQLKRLIECWEPDLVLTDIMMPFQTGLEVLQWYNETYEKAKFIIISGFEEFAYAKEAIKNGAVDYLLKPVGKTDLEDAIEKALATIKTEKTAKIFVSEKDEFQKLFEKINDGQDYANEDLYRVFEESKFDISDCFLVGISMSILPDVAAALKEESFAHYNLVRFSVANRLNEAFHSRKLGFVVKSEETAVHVMGTFRNADRGNFVEKYVRPILNEVGEQCSVRLCAGIGDVIDNPTDMLRTHKDAIFALGMYPFIQKQIICSNEIHREFGVTFEEYKDSLDELFKQILAKHPYVLDQVDRVMDNIEELHFANWNAVKMRTMNFTGEMAGKMLRYKMFPGSFYETQDALQKEIEGIYTVSDLKQHIREYFASIIGEIYDADKVKDKALIEEVKEYIKTHYAEDLSIRELSEVACVSQNYFSAMFKKETGQNYKAYLTDIRMEKAIELLRTTDQKTYEIGENVGYNNVRRFVDAFKKKYDMSPMNYKKKMKS